MYDVVRQLRSEPNMKIGLIALSAFALLTAAGCSSADSSDTTDDSSDSEALLAGRVVGESEVANDLRNAGFPESEIGPMICTAKYESSFYERASHHNSNGTTDYGLFQINSIHLGDPGCPSTVTGLYDSAKNARCAYEVYRAQGIDAWYGYKRHRATCSNFPAP
jgi:lysozyme C